MNYYEEVKNLYNSFQSFNFLDCQELADSTLNRGVEILKENEKEVQNGMLLSGLLASESKDFLTALNEYAVKHQKKNQKVVIKKENSSMTLLEASLMELVNTSLDNKSFEIQEKLKNELTEKITEKIEEIIKTNLKKQKPEFKKIQVITAEKKISIDEVTHAKFEEVLQYVANNEPVYLTGGAGTGKNVLCKQVAKALDLPFYFTNCVTQEYKIQGFVDAQGVYHKTQFYEAFKNGGLFMLDEMDASIPEALIVLNSAIANRYFDFPEGKDIDGNRVGGYTEAHPNFRVISAGNTVGTGADAIYCGRNQLDGASLNRFAMIHIDYDKRIEKACAEGDEELVSFIEELRLSAKEAGLSITASYRDITRICKMSKILDLGNVLESCLFKGLEKDDVNILTACMEPENKYTKATRKHYKLSCIR